MEGLFIYFLGVLALNVAASLFAFGVAFSTRSKPYTITWLRGGVILIVGWLLGSVIYFLAEIALGLGGIVVENTLLEFPLALCVLLPIMFLLFAASKPKPLPPAM